MKMNKVLKSKKSQSSEASTIVWIAATFIIFFILIGYLISTQMLFVKKGGLAAEISPLEISNEMLTEKMINFLNSPAYPDGTVFDLLLKSELKDGNEDIRASTFKDMTLNFLKTNFPGEYSGFISLIPSSDVQRFDEGYRLSVIGNYFVEYNRNLKAQPGISNPKGLSIPVSSSRSLYVYIIKT